MNAVRYQESVLRRFRWIREGPPPCGPVFDRSARIHQRRRPKAGLATKNAENAESAETEGSIFVRSVFFAANRLIGLIFPPAPAAFTHGRNRQKVGAYTQIKRHPLPPPLWAALCAICVTCLCSFVLLRYPLETSRNPGIHESKITRQVRAVNSAMPW